MAESLLGMPCLRRAPVAFHCASTECARPRLAGHRSIIEGRKLALEAEQLKVLSTILIL